MVTGYSKQVSCKSKEVSQTVVPQTAKQVSPLRQGMIRDMELAGLAPRTQCTYIGAVMKLQKYYNIRPDKLTEKQVQKYIFWLRDEKKVARGTFQTDWYGLKFFYYHFLCVDWTLFTHKKVRLPRRQRLPVPIEWNDGLRLIEAIEKPAYRLCCSCMLALGLRISSVLALTVHSIDANQMVVRIVGKRNN